MTTTDKGQKARTPSDIPLSGWKDVVIRAYGEIGRNNIGLVAAGVAFYGLLAIFPAIAAIFAMGGLLLEPSAIQDQLRAIAGILPAAASEIITTQVTSVASGSSPGLGLTTILGLALALWSASKGVGALMEGINIAYDEEETRGTIRLTLLRLSLTVAIAVGLIFGLMAIMVLPSILSIVTLGATVEAGIGLARWAVLLLSTFGGLMLLYRYAPSRDNARWQWLVPGALVATFGWLLASVAFAVYAENFGSYQETFGTIAGVVILLTWLWISAFIVLAGAQINGEAEAQTHRDSTVGPREKRGERNAVKADEFVPGHR